MFREASFTSACLQMNDGDTLFLYTDGLSEARRENDEYGIDRVMGLVSRQSSSTTAGLISACLNDLRGFTGGSSGLDDLTLLAIRRSG